MVGKPLTLESLWATIHLEFAGEPQPLRQMIAPTEDFINEFDTSGVIWPVGLYKELLHQYNRDSRYVFMTRMSRSAFFGEILVDAYAESIIGGTNENMIRCARLVNLFVTSFDSVCDEISEQLPETLRSIVPLFQKFPHPLTPAIYPSRNLCGFTLSIAQEVARELGSAILTFREDQQKMLSKPITNAFQNQLNELSISTVKTEDALSVIDLKSIGPFEVILSIPHILTGNLENYNSVKPISQAMGAFFGWIDDIVDYEKDVKSGKVTSVQILIESNDNPSSPEKILIEETHRRYEVLLKVLKEHRLNNMKHALEKSIALWI